MTQDEFWKLIEETRGDDPEEIAERLQAALEQRSADEIVAFELQMAEVLNAGYTWNLWGAAYLINGGCSDDGFEYFRGWLLTQGREVYEQACRDPDSLADLPDLEEEVECEDVLYVAFHAYQEVTGEEELPRQPNQLPDLGEGWDFDDDDEMRARYPKLFAKFCEE